MPINVGTARRMMKKLKKKKGKPRSDSTYPRGVPASALHKSVKPRGFPPKLSGRTRQAQK